MAQEFFRYSRFYFGNAFRFITSPWLSLELPVEDLTNIFACSFGGTGWHPLVETLNQYLARPDLNCRDSALYNFHMKFKPGSTDEALFGRGQKVELFNYPWGSFNRNQIAKNVQNSRFCGPSSEKFIEDEFNRTITLLNDVKKNGFNPWAFGNSFVGGTLLRHSDGRRKFVVLQGNHRTACLSVLGMKTIKVRLYPSYLLDYVDRDQVNQWPLVRSGELTPNEALTFFDTYFAQDGRHILRRIS